MNAALKKAVEQLFDLCGPSGGYPGQDRIGNSLEREQLKKECIHFLSYISASDGTISECEAEFISDYFGCRMSAEELRAYIDNNKTYTIEFEQRVPETLERLVAEDNRRYDEHKELEESSSEAYISVFECLGKEFIVCDGNSDDQEVEDYTTYITTLRSYKKENARFSNKSRSAVSTDNIHPGKNIPRFNENGEREESLEELLTELNNLVGLDEVKKDVNSLIHLQEIRRLRKERGLKEIPVSNHLVFYGNPGTGNTTVARLLARIYHAMGLLSKGQFIETDRSGLVAGYVGQTALKVQDLVEKSLGGILFIDEAYALTDTHSENDYGREAVDTLLKAMEDHRDDFIVIAAGYPELMAHFVDSNPGLRSRFNKHIYFEDYRVEELYEIFKRMCENTGYILTSEALDHSYKVFEQKYENRGKNFANGREVRNYFEKAIMKQADRMFFVKNPSDEELCTILVADVQDI